MECKAIHEKKKREEQNDAFPMSRLDDSVVGLGLFCLAAPLLSQIVSSRPKLASFPRQS